MIPHAKARMVKMVPTVSLTESHRSSFRLRLRSKSICFGTFLMGQSISKVSLGRPERGIHCWGGFDGPSVLSPSLSRFIPFCRHMFAPIQAHGAFLQKECIPQRKASA